MIVIELAGQKRPEVRQLQLLHQVLVLRDDFTDIGQRTRSRENFIDRPFQAWRDQRPSFPDHAPGSIVETVERQTGFEGLDYSG